VRDQSRNLLEELGARTHSVSEDACVKLLTIERALERMQLEAGELANNRGPIILMSTSVRDREADINEEKSD
jgi:hypothetical protein